MFKVGDILKPKPNDMWFSWAHSTFRVVYCSKYNGKNTIYVVPTNSSAHLLIHRKYGFTYSHYTYECHFDRISSSDGQMLFPFMLEK